MVICLERGADLHMAQLIPLRTSKSRLVFTFLVLAHPGSPGKRAVKRVCVLLTLNVEKQTVHLSKISQQLAHRHPKPLPFVIDVFGDDRFLYSCIHEIPFSTPETCLI